METIVDSGSYSFSRKLFLLAKVIHFNGNHYPQLKSLLLVEANFSVEDICFIRSYSFQWKILFLVETVPFRGSHYFQWKSLACSSISSIQWKLFLLMEGISFIFFLVETAPFNRDFSFQWKPFFLVYQHFRQQKLRPVT